VNRPDVLVSYAQNHEDIVLARIFEPWTRSGHWIDIGAGHPILDSVTKLFSDFDWCGINVEPLKQEFDALSIERPKDLNLNLAVGLSSGRRDIFEGPPNSRGTSTMLRELAYEIDGEPFKTTVVEVATLQSIVDSAPWPVDFVKIDVEGFEREVIDSFDWNSSDVDVVLVEATHPNSCIPSHDSWELTLLDAGYQFRLFDGLNRFYSRTDHAKSVSGQLIDPWYPATAQDRFLTFDIKRLVEQTRHLEAELGTQMRVNEERLTYIQSLLENIKVTEIETRSLRASAEILQREVHDLKKSHAETESRCLDQVQLISDLSAQVTQLALRLEQRH
jgi:FkbM family methyltransferase